MDANSWAAIGVLVTLGAQGVVFLRWMARRMRDDDISRMFVKDMATNHLPHIYHALQRLARKQGVELEEPPLVQFVAFNGRKKAS